MSSVHDIEKRIVSIWFWLVLALPCVNFVYLDAEIRKTHQSLAETQRCHVNPEWDQHLYQAFAMKHPHWPKWYRNMALFQAKLYHCQ